MKKNLTSNISHSSTDRQKWEGGMAHKWERGGLVGKEMDYFIFYLYVYATNSMANVIIYLKLRSHTKSYWEDNIDNNCPYTIYRCYIYFSILDCKVLHEKNHHLQYCAKGDVLLVERSRTRMKSEIIPFEKNSEHKIRDLGADLLYHKNCYSKCLQKYNYKKP